MGSRALFVSALLGIAVIISGVSVVNAQATRPAEDAAANQPDDFTGVAKVSPEMQAASDAIKAAVASVITDLGSDNLNKRQAAQRKLTALSENVLREVLAQANRKDPEQAVRIETLFDTLWVSTKLGRFMLGLTEDQRKAVLKMARARPAKFNDLFTDDPGLVIAAVATLSKDPDAGDIVIQRAISSPDRLVRLAGLRYATNVKKTSQKLRDLVYDLYENPPAQIQMQMDHNEQQKLVFYVHYGSNDHQDVPAVLNAMISLKDKRVLPILLNCAISQNNRYSYNRRQLIEKLAKFKDKSIVVTLVPYLDNTRTLTNGSHNGRRYTLKVCDLVLAILLSQTDQSRGDYGLEEMDSRNRHDDKIRFYSDKDRAAALKKFAEWWQKHSKDYEGVDEIQLSGASRRRTPVRRLLPNFIQAIAN